MNDIIELKKYLNDKLNGYKDVYKDCLNDLVIFNNGTIETIIDDDRYMCLLQNNIKKAFFTKVKDAHERDTLKRLILCSLCLSYESIIHPLNYIKQKRNDFIPQTASQLFSDLDIIHNHVYVKTIYNLLSILNNIYSGAPDNRSKGEKQMKHDLLLTLNLVSDYYRSNAQFQEKLDDDKFYDAKLREPDIYYEYADIFRIESAPDNLPKGLVRIGKDYAVSIPSDCIRIDERENEVYYLLLKLYNGNINMDLEKQIHNTRNIEERSFAFKKSSSPFNRKGKFVIRDTIKGADINGDAVNKAIAIMKHLKDRTDDIYREISPDYGEACVCDRIGRIGYRFIAKEAFSKIAKETRVSRIKEEKVITKKAAIAFLDIDNFKDFCKKNSNNGEMIFRITNDTFNNVIGDEGEKIGKLGGYFDKFIGDCTMIVFSKDVEKQIEHIIINLCNMATNNNMMVDSEFIPELAIGVHYGDVSFGKLKAREYLSEWAALGNNVNIASMLQDIAEGQQIVISRSTIELYAKIKQKEMNEKKGIDISWLGNGMTKRTFCFQPYKMHFDALNELAGRADTSNKQIKEYGKKIKKRNEELVEIHKYLIASDKGYYENMKPEDSIWIGTEKNSN